MTFPSSGLLGLAQGILNTTVAQSAANVANPNVTPVANRYTAVGVNTGPSLSLAATGYGNGQGVCGNPTGRVGSTAPQQLCNLANSILTMVNYTYRM